jgi:hypothetical protein
MVGLDSVDGHLIRRLCANKAKGWAGTAKLWLREAPALRTSPFLGSPGRRRAHLPNPSQSAARFAAEVRRPHAA